MQHILYRDSQETATSIHEVICNLNKKQLFYLKKDFPLLNEKVNDTCTEFYLTESEKILAAEMEKLRRGYRERFENGEELYITSRPFYEIKATIEKDPLYQSVFKLMPKGGLLHIHSSAALSMESFNKLLNEWDKLYPSKVEIQERSPNSIFVVTQELQSEIGDGKIPQYTLYYWESIQKLSVQYPTIAGSAAPIFDYITDVNKWAELSDMLSFCSNRTEKIPYIWDELNLMFIRIDDLFSNKDFYLWYHMYFFEECLKDNIQYVEMRSGFVSFSEPAKELEQSHLVALHPKYSYRKHFYYKEMLMGINYDKPDFLDILLEALDNVNKQHTEQSLIVKVILNVRRDLDPQNEQDNKKIKERLDYAICYHNAERFKKYNNFVIGFDFVSEEDRGRPTSEYLNYIYGYTEAEDVEKKPRIQLIDFYLHDGESNWNSICNILDAVIVSKYRIGHGFNMAKYPGIINNLTFTEYEQGYKSCYQTTFPFLEICPISNQLLRYFPDLRNHSAYQLMTNGIQCVLSNDDPFMFGNPGLSYDFWMAYVGMNIDFPFIKRLVYNSILPLDYNLKTKNEEFDKKWDNFVGAALKKIQTT